jgi:hypothetical protein
MTRTLCVGVGGQVHDEDECSVPDEVCCDTEPAFDTDTTSIEIVLPSDP